MLRLIIFTYLFLDCISAKSQKKNYLYYLNFVALILHYTNVHKNENDFN